MKSELTWLTNPRMHLFHIPQCSIQNRNVHISVLNGALWDMEQVHSEICEIGLLPVWFFTPVASCTKEVNLRLAKRPMGV